MTNRHGRLSLDQEGRLLVERLGGCWSAQGGMCRCPAHEDRTPSLSVRPGRTRLLFHCFAGCDAAAVLEALQSGRLLEPRAAPAQQSAGRASGSRLQAAALGIWGESRSIQGTAADHYLSERGLSSDSPELRFHPRVPHGRTPLTRFRPALVAAVRDETGVVAIHRSFLEHRGGGVAPLLSGRAGLGRFGRGAVRLGGAAHRLGLAEGIETALSATALFGVPCWVALGTERFRVVALPPEVRELLLFLDHDSGGRRAERLARDAFAHLPLIEAHYPPVPGEDWNDVLRTSAGGSKG
jgi:putative DNA primase/helicase